MSTARFPQKLKMFKRKSPSEDLAVHSASSELGFYR